MNILVINGSPKGPASVTAQTMRYLELLNPGDSFTYLDASQKIRQLEKDFSPAAEAISGADVLVFCYPVYTFMAPYQLHRFVELLKEHVADGAVTLTGKAATQVSTSKHFYDVTAHRYIEDNCADLGLGYVKGLSADMDDLTTKKGQKEAQDFFAFLKFSVENKVFEAPRCTVVAPATAGTAGDTTASTGLADTTSASAGKDASKTISIITNAAPGDAALIKLIMDFQESVPYQTKIFNIAEFGFKGGCLGCFHCATTGECIYKDGFQALLKEIQSHDAMVYAFTIKDHSMGASFKQYDDRQFANGHRTVTMGMPIGYLVNGDYAAEENLHLLVEGRANVGHNYFAGVATNKAELVPLTAKLDYAMRTHYDPPQNFYGVGGMKIFRDLIYVMGGMMKADYAFYKAKGFFNDMPHKQHSRIFLMKLVGAMLSNKKLMAKAGNKMTDGMLAPYTKVLDAAKKEAAVTVRGTAEQAGTGEKE